jgi:integrase
MNWRDNLAKRLAPASVNRISNVLRAILNRHADSDETIVSRRAWEVGLASLPEAEEHNNVVLDDAAIRKLVIAAREESAEFGLLVETLATTGGRISQLARCKVRDLVGDADTASLMVPSSAKGQKKRMTAAPVPIPAGLADRLRVAATARKALPADPLLVKPSGEAWAKSDHSRLFDRASIAAGINPKPPKPEKGQKPAAKSDEWISIYALRHSHISAQIMALVPLAVISKTHDTSVPQIEKHYAATIAKIGDSVIRNAMTDFDQPSADVIRLRK